MSSINQMNKGYDFIGNKLESITECIFGSTVEMNQTDKEYLNPENDWDRIKNNLPEHKDFLDTFDHFISEDLMLTNLKIINNIVKLFAIDTELTVDYETDLRSTERLVDICCAHGADKYLAGIGSKEYLNESLFEDRGIEVIYQDVKEPVHTLETL